MQLPLFIPNSDWRPPHELPSFRDAKRVAIDVETNDEHLSELGPGTRRGAYMVGVSIGIDEGPCWYIPFGHEDSSDNLNKSNVMDWLEYEARHFKGELVGANIVYDLDFLAQELIPFPSAKAIKDIQVAEALIDENQFSYSLDNIAKKYKGIGKDEALLTEAAQAHFLDKKKDLWRLPARFVGPYAEADVRLPLEILRCQEAEIEKQGLQNIWKLEQRVTPVLLKMLRYGVRVDEERLEACKAYFVKREEEYYVKIQQETGTDMRGLINTPAEIADVLRKRGIVLPRTEKSNKESVTKDVLDALDDPVADMVRQAKKYNKATGTFYNSVKSRLTNGRLHPSFHQLRSDAGGTVTGRLSSSDPNIQQQPVRDPEIGKMWRSIYVPDNRCLWCRNDYKAQEPRLFLHYAAKVNATGARSMAQKYKENPLLDPYKVLCDTLPKDHVKIIYLGRSYGMGDDKLRANVTRALREQGTGGDIDMQVTGILYQFAVSAPYFAELPKMVTKRAEEVGYIVSILGGKCRFPDPTWTYKATNRLIQRSAAEQTKQAMVDLDGAGWTPHFQVHDELDFSVPNEGAAVAIKHIMENAVQLEVPVVCEMTLGESWGDCK